MDKREHLGPINLLCALVKITFKILNCIASEEIYSETLCTLAFSCQVGFLVLCPKRAVQSERRSLVTKLSHTLAKKNKQTNQQNDF